MFQLKMHIPTIPLFNPAQSPPILRREVGQSEVALVDELATLIRAKTPVGATGEARAAVATRVILATDATHLARGEVYADLQRAPYWPYLEAGTRPHWPPRAPLEAWAQRVLGDRRLWFVVARAISRRGTRPRHIWRDAWRQVHPTILQRVTDAVARATRLLLGGH